MVFSVVDLFIYLFVLLTSASSGEARSAYQEAWKARTGRHQPGSAGSQGVAEKQLNERNHSKIIETYHCVLNPLESIRTWFRIQPKSIQM